ncbi:hypothetical protein ACCM60_25090 [Pseudomonas chlororaphis subsp. aureofaciens]|uniref:hypothetical protein n=1 Tax=Pseudomonas chlororaphis TaxID=587753 RepID=UPI003556B1A6
MPCPHPASIENRCRRVKHVEAAKRLYAVVPDAKNIDLIDIFKHLFALFNQINWRIIHFTPTAQNVNEPGVTTMKSKLILALTLSVLAANTFAADGYDRTGSATFTSGSSASASLASDGFDRTGTAAAIAADGFDHTGTAGAVASDGFDHTGTAGAVASDGFDHTGTAGAVASDGFDHTGTAGAVASDGFDRTGTADAIAADGFDRTGTAAAIG